MSTFHPSLPVVHHLRRIGGVALIGGILIAQVCDTFAFAKGGHPHAPSVAARHIVH
jgi:hypothetical protein